MEALNTQLLRLFDWLLWTTIQGSVLIVLILLIQLILRRRLPVRWHYLLWGLLLIRLAVPWLPESRISIFNLVPRSIQQGRMIESLSERGDVGRFGFYSGMRSAGTQETTAESDSRTIFAKFVRMLPLLWLLGTVVIAGYVCARSISLWRTVKRERPITDSQILDLLEDCKMQMGVQTILGVVVSDRIKSPALFGFVRPRLLLPQGMLETYSLEELRYVFVHELAHLRQRDIYLGWLMALLQVVHWFNPLMWFAFGRMRADRELACDTLAISMLAPHEPPEYGRTIVNLLQSFSQVRYLPSVAGILEDTCQIERRIKMIADYKKTSRTRWAGAMLLLAVLACVVLTNAYVAKADFTFGGLVNLKLVIPAIDAAHDSINCFSYDGLNMYFVSDGAGGYGGWDLWVLRRASKDDGWGPPENLGPAINTPKGEGGATISADGLVLCFESDRPGGYGKYDIYMATRATMDAPWGQPVNMGPTINSSALEGNPWILPDGLELYFSSVRPDGFGGGDIYMTRRATTNDPWDKPVNLGPIVNSTYDEGYISLSPDGRLLLFSEWGGPPWSTPRPGGYGGCDMWMTRRENVASPWQAPVNLGAQVNGPEHSILPRISPDSSTLYFSTNSAGIWDNWQASILPVVDFNGDGIVDCVDICMLVDHMDTNEPLYDIAPVPLGDGIVDAQDLIELTEHLTKKQADPNAVTP
jgi:beta-lactamase regulating signal transducer with metallopeptidase domain